MPIVTEDAEVSPPRFEPSRHAPRSRQVAALVFGPLLWLSALLVVALVVRRTSAIELGLLIVLGSMVLASIVVGLCRIGRGREERRHAAGG